MQQNDTHENNFCSFQTILDTKSGDPSVQIKKARRKLRSNLIPQNRANLLRLKYELKDEIKLDNIFWTEKTNSDFNEKIFEKFFEQFKHFNRHKLAVSRPMLKNNKERVTAISEKANFSRKTFFRCGHLNGKNFDENVLTEAKYVVNMALGTARGNVEQD